MHTASKKVVSADDRRLEMVRELERESASATVAYDKGAPRFAPLSEERVMRLKFTEKELGVALLAYGSLAGR